MEHAIKVFIIGVSGIIPVGGIIYLCVSLRTGKIITREQPKLLAFKTVSIKEDRKAFWISWSAFFIFFLTILIIFIFQTISKWDLPLKKFLSN